MNKEELYRQIQAFNNQLTNPSDRSSNNYEKAYLYVDNKNAEDKANFIAYMIGQGHMQNSYNTILDLAFGSGNLTSHIIFDNEIKYKDLILNDLNDTNTNQDIINYIDNCDIQHENMLDLDSFKDKDVDLVIVNPQIGGNYIDGDILGQKEENETQQDVLDRLGIKLNNFLDNGTTILFYGKEKDFKSIVSIDKYIKYSSKLTDLFVISLDVEKFICFEKSGKEFIECVNIAERAEKVESFDDIKVDTYDSESNSVIKQEKEIMNAEEKKEEFNTDSIEYRVCFPS